MIITRFNGTVNKSGQSRLLNKLREYHGEWVQNSLALVLDKNDNELKQGNSSIYRFCKSNSIFFKLYISKLFKLQDLDKICRG